MITFHVGVWVVAAVLLFWTVGAYNRLVTMRNAIVSSFAPVDDQFSARLALLRRQLDAVAPILANAGPRLEALQAACQQADLARAHAKTHPGAPGAITSLRLADDILAEARGRLPLAAVGGPEIAELHAQLSASDTALGFARDRFNAAVLDYNRAVRQVPTRLIAAVFGFAPSGTL